MSLVMSVDSGIGITPGHSRTLDSATL